ncbi:hypothetical protein FBULB1_5836 [Fusarium bulbicola]|nr:hypothetical protein FBULB1_5836 [Fusarium bulbicola]
MAKVRSKKAKKQPATRGRDGHVWSNTQRLELLAFLSWCFQHNNSDHFSTFVSRHLLQATSQRFTKLQVRKKLHGEWRKHGMCEKFTNLYSLGTAGFEPFGAEDQREIDLTSLRLEKKPPMVGRYLRSASLALTSSRADPARTRQLREHGAPSAPSSLPKSQAVNASSYQTRSQTIFFSLRGEQEAHLKQDEFPRPDSADVSDSEESELSLPPPLDPEPDRLGTILQSQEAESSSETQLPPSPSLKTKLRIAEEELLKAQGRELTFMNRTSELEADLKDRHHCERSEPIDPVESRRQISLLKTRVSSLEKLGGTIPSIYDLSPDDHLPKQRPGFSQLAQSWAKRIFGIDMSALLAYAHDADVPKDKLVAAILTAGIFHLLFKSDFPEMLSMDSPFFTEYTRLVSISAGRDKAQKIELAAIKQAFANEQVKNKRLHDKGRCLSSIILRTIDFFMPSSCHGMSESSFNSLSDDEKSALTALEYGLAHALQIKVELALPDRRIRYFFFKPGALFDGDLMEGGMSQIGVPVNGRLKLYVSPALFSAPDGDGEGEDSRFGGHREGMIEAETSELESLVRVAKARVLF